MNHFPFDQNLPDSINNQVFLAKSTKKSAWLLKYVGSFVDRTVALSEAKVPRQG
jgi:hypothetical protein